MQVLILAAGRGSRLGNKTTDVPKCLLEVGRRPLIEHQLETLAEAGLGPVGMVVGYCADEIREAVGIRADFIDNPRWSRTNSLYSFWLASDWIKGAVLVMNSDILVHPRIIDRLLNTKGDAFAYDSSSGHGREHMKVHLAGKRLVNMSKTMPAESVDGENVGILKLTEDTARKLLEKAGQIAGEGGENKWIGSAVCELAREREITGVDVAGLPWGEVDFSYDLDRVRKEVWPAIEKDRPGARALRNVVRAAAIAVLLLLIFVFVRLSVPTVESAWDRIDLASVEKVTITAGERTKMWSVLTADQIVEVQVSGPRRVRLDSRVALGREATEPEPYVLELSLDGKRVDWFKRDGEPSSTWTGPGWSVAKKDRVTLDVPAGDHVIGIRLVAAVSGRCLLQVRQEEDDTLD